MQQLFTYIEAIASKGSFSKAAEELCITQPALSIAIGKEERRIGMPLFDRSAHPILPTDAGRAYLEAIGRCRQEEERLEERILDIKNLDVGYVRLGGSHYFNAYMLPGMLSSFSQRYPGITLSLEEHGSDVLQGMLKEHTLDVTFSCNTAFMADFERYPLFTDHLLVAVPKEDTFNTLHRREALSAKEVVEGRHLSPDCPALSPKELATLSYIYLRPGNNLYERSCQFFQSSPVQPKVKLFVSQLVTSYHLSQSAFASTIVCDTLVREGDPLCFYRMDSPASERKFYMLVAGRGYTSHALSTFIHYASGFFHGAIDLDGEDKGKVKA